MAGIGFRLERLAVEGGLAGTLMAVFTGALLASGHWLLTIFGVGATSAVSRAIGNPQVAEDFRLITIYAFGIASATSATVLLPGTRYFADAIYSREPDKAPALLFASFLVAGVASALVAALIYGAVIRQPLEVTFTGVGYAALVAMIWAVSTFCSAVFAVRAVLLSYFVGTFAGVLGTVLVVLQGGGAAAMALAYAGGLAITLGALVSVFLAAFPFPIGSIRKAVVTLLGSISQFLSLSVGALLGTLAIWSSTLVIWFSAYGATNTTGFRAAELYDTPHFFGLLALVPGFALLLVFFETSVFRSLRRHYDMIESHAALDELDASERQMHATTMKGITMLAAVQVVVAIAFVVAAPLAAERDLLQLRQVSIMQITALGSVMHLIIILSTMVLIYVDARRLFCLVQAVFLIGTIVASVLALPLGERYFGIGYLAGTSVGAIAGVLAAQSVLSRLNAHLFMGAARRAHRTWGRLRS
jgi:polysaccharide biosynthesis protein PelG